MAAPASDAVEELLSSPRLTPKTIRRVRVHRRYRPPFYRTLHFRLISFLIIIGIFVDVLHPRLDAQSVADAASLDDLSVLYSHPACRARVPNSDRARTRWTVLSLSSGGLVRESLLCWTPAESVSILHISEGTTSILPASWASVNWIAKNGSATLTPLPRAGRGILGRFRAFSVDTLGAPAVVLEHASGFLPFRMLQRSFLEAVVACTPWPLLRFPIELGSELVPYARLVLIPSSARVFYGSACGLFAQLDRPFAKAREFAENMRERQQR